VGVGLAADDLVIVEEFWVSLLLGNQKGNHLITSIKHIEAASPLAVNGDTFVIGGKLVVGLNAVCVVTFGVILEEGEFFIRHTERWGLLYGIYHGIYSFKSIIIWGPGLESLGRRGGPGLRESSPQRRAGQVTRVGIHI